MLYCPDYLKISGVVLCSSCRELATAAGAGLWLPARDLSRVLGSAGSWESLPVEGEFATLTQLLWLGTQSFQAAESGCGLFADSSADVDQISTG